jgi:hypothetical protein
LPARALRVLSEVLLNMRHAEQAHAERRYYVPNRGHWVGAVVALAVLGGLGRPASGAVTPLPEPSGFTTRINNPWYPLIGGTKYVYRGVKDGLPSRDVLTITHHFRRVDGVRCVVVQDRLYLSGYLEERTTEWYSQDKHGNVWYFGEDTAELDRNGHVKNTDGTWRAGVDGAKPGIYMPAHPAVGDVGQQELYKDQAQDRFEVLSLHAHVTVPFTSSNQALLTKEWTPLEPRVIDHKLYVRGIGTVLEQTVKGGSERAALVSFKSRK